MICLSCAVVAPLSAASLPGAGGHSADAAVCGFSYARSDAAPLPLSAAACRSSTRSRAVTACRRRISAALAICIGRGAFAATRCSMSRSHAASALIGGGVGIGSGCSMLSRSASPIWYDSTCAMARAVSEPMEPSVSLRNGRGGWLWSWSDAAIAASTCSASDGCLPTTGAPNDGCPRPGVVVGDAIVSDISMARESSSSSVVRAVGCASSAMDVRGVWQWCSR